MSIHLESQWVMPTNNHPPPYDTANTKARLISLAAILVSVLTLLYSTNQLDGWEQTALNALASAVLSIGIVSFLYEVFLRAEVSREILRLVGIERSIASNAISRVGDAAEIDWHSLLSSASRYRILLADPSSWIEAHWSRIMAAGKERAIDVELYFPDPDGDHFRYVANFLDIGDDELAGSVTRAKNVIESSWKLAAENNALTMKSRIKIGLINIFPAYSLIKSDRTATVLITAATGRIPADNGFSITFEGPKEDYPMRWLSGNFERLSATASAYENVVTK